MTKTTKILATVGVVLAIVAAGLFATNTGLLKGQIFLKPSINENVKKIATTCPLSSNQTLYDSRERGEGTIYISFDDFVSVVKDGVIMSLQNCKLSLIMNRANPEDVGAIDFLGSDLKYSETSDAIFVQKGTSPITINASLGSNGYAFSNVIFKDTNSSLSFTYDSYRIFVR